jgi:hypothetical protein
MSLGSGLVPLKERVDNPWVSLPGLAFSYLWQPLFLDVSMLLLGSRACSQCPAGGHLTLGCGEAGGRECHGTSTCSCRRRGPCPKGHPP